MDDVTDAGAAIRQRLDDVAADIERLIERLLNDAPLAEEPARPPRLMDSMRYVSLAGGKRLRPFLVVESVALVLALARAAGLGGMVGGQMLDLAAEGRFDGGKVQKLGAPDVKLLQTMKTGALLRFGCIAGAILGEATPEQREALDRYGTLLGEAFQIADDLLDVEGDAATVGKATGKDAAAGKGTFVTALGLDAAKTRLKDLDAQAEQALSPFGRDADVLKMAARFVAERKA